MSQTERSTAPSEQMLDQLEALLAAPAFDNEAFPLDVLQGFLCAVLSAPVSIPDDDWMAIALGPTPRYESDAQYEQVRDLLIRFRDTLEVELRAEDGISLILYPPDPDSKEFDFASWCSGYLEGVALAESRPDLPEDAALNNAQLLPFLVLAGVIEEEPDLVAEVGLDTPAKMATFTTQCRENLIDVVLELYELGLTRRLKPETVRRETAKVGRNEPCPCGSGRKYKACHGAS